MTAILDQYITKEAKEAAEATGFNIALEIMNLLKQNIPVAEIAAQFKMSTSDVEKVKMML
jgi:hypothetical protein